MGFPGNIICSNANKWTEDFYAYLLAGYTVQDSVDCATNNQSSASGLTQPVVCGNGNYRLGE